MALLSFAAPTRSVDLMVLTVVDPQGRPKRHLYSVPAFPVWDRRGRRCVRRWLNAEARRDGLPASIDYVRPRDGRITNKPLPRRLQ